MILKDLQLARFSLADDVQIQQREMLYQGFMSLERLELKFRRYEGGWSNIVSRELLVRKPAAGVLVWDPQREELLLIEQFRPGTLNDERSPWCLEIIAGITDVLGESLEELLRREAQEEAGIAVQEFVKLPSYFVSPGGTDEQMHLFLATADLTNAGGVHGLASESEDIRSVVVKEQQLMDLLTQGYINNAACLIAVQWFLLHKEELKQRFS